MCRIAQPLNVCWVWSGRGRGQREGSEEEEEDERLQDQATGGVDQGTCLSLSSSLAEVLVLAGW